MLTSYSATKQKRRGKCARRDVSVLSLYSFLSIASYGDANEKLVLTLLDHYQGHAAIKI